MITLDSLHFSYKGSHPIIVDLSWSFETGTMTAITGPSGTGKSTLLYLLGLMLTPTAGSVSFDSDAVSSWSDARRSSWRAVEIGFVFQDAALDPTRTVIDNIVESSVYRRLKRSTAVQRGHDLMSDLEVDVPANRRPGQVSGGQAQRIALCRALVGNPSIVLGDEPTGNLDTGSATAVISKLETAASEGRTVVVATHDEAVVKRCDSVLHI